MLERLGPYLIDEQIGRGGMGFVYSARHENTGEQVAVKMLSNALEEDHNFRDRFHQEIETLKQLQHTAIVQIIGYGQEGGDLFYAMELVKGRTLFQILKETGPLSWREVTRIAIDICHALKHAHDRGVIHRDLKPSNLFLTEDDKVKLVDFGIARLFGATQLTADHAVLGTADYMAPEQAEGARPTAKSDLYSLGSVMYALLTGRPPFASASVGQIIHKLKYDHPHPITETAANVPLELDYIVRQLLSKNPDNRIPTPLAVAHRLQAMQYALEANMPVKSTPSTVELAGEKDSVSDDATMEYIPTGQQNDNATIDGDYLSQIENSAGLQDSPGNVITNSETQQNGPAADPTHYTTIGPEHLKSENESPAGIVASLLVLVALIAGLGALLAFTNWYNQPRSAEELLEIIDDAKLTPGSDWGQASKEMQEFLKRFPEHQQFSLVQNHYNTLKNERDEQRFLKSLENNLSQLPIPKVTLRQILESDTFSPSEKIIQLKHFVTLYEAQKNDPVVAECVIFARKKIERMEQIQTELLQAHQDIHRRTELEIREMLKFCLKIEPENRTSAIEILNAIYEIHKFNDEFTDVLSEVVKLRNELKKQTD